MQDAHGRIWKHDMEDQNVRRFPAILRTNRQIYDEASSLLYSELNVILQPGNALCFEIGRDIVKASERLWRHNPLNGTCTTSSSPLTVCGTTTSDGVMARHVLARFKRFTFDLDFNWGVEGFEVGVNPHMTNGDDNTAPSPFVNEAVTKYFENEALKKYSENEARRSTIIHQLIGTVSNSRGPVHCHMTMHIEVLASHDMSHFFFYFFFFK